MKAGKDRNRGVADVAGRAVREWWSERGPIDGRVLSFRSAGPIKLNRVQGRTAGGAYTARAWTRRLTRSTNSCGLKGLVR